MAVKNKPQHYKISGMSCAACSAHVEKAVRTVSGVETCAVNLLMNSMTVEGDASSEDIIRAVENAGYGAELVSEGGISHSTDDDRLSDTETPALKKRLLLSFIILIPLMYISMGHVMFSFPLPDFLSSPSVIAVSELALSAAVIFINRKFYINGFKGAVHGAPNMDTLVALGSAASFIYSLFITGSIFSFMGIREIEKAHGLLHGLYFESAAMILALITVGKTLESISKGRTKDALRSLMKLSPKTARLKRSDGSEAIVGINEIVPGDMVSVLPGEQIPVDGTVEEGSSAVDESSLTGESIPADKLPGDKVFAGTFCSFGYLLIRAEKTGEDSTVSQIIKMVSEASDTKAPIARIADKVSGIFVPAVLGIALLTLIIWLSVGKPAGFALTMAVSVLVISCPCALGLATPVAIMVGNGIAAKHGILFKTSEALENAGKIKNIALDKTGTVTKGIPAVTDVISYIDDKGLMLRLFASLEQYSSHPLAAALSEYAKAQGTEPLPVTDFREEAGKGPSCTVSLSGKMISLSARAAVGKSDDALEGTAFDTAAELSSQGKTPVAFFADGKLAGLAAFADEIKPDSFEAVKALKDIGMSVTMLTGDNRRTAETIAEKAGIDKVLAGVLPQEKANAISSMQTPTAMVGDGINDAPALMASDIGIAIGAGTDVAVDAAEVVLMKNSLMDVYNAVIISRETLRCIRQNLFWAFFYNCIGIPLAAGALYTAFGLRLSPMIGAAAMSLSSFCVVTNALSLNIRIPGRLKASVPFALEKDKEKDRNKQPVGVSGAASNDVLKRETEDTMDCSRSIKIEGMMCSHCEMTVKKALEALSGVEKAEASHEDGCAKVWFKAGESVTDDALKAAVEAKEYAVKGFE